MSYTYDTRDDYKGFDKLTESAYDLGDRINQEARKTGADRLDLLRSWDGSAEDKAALAEIWGGPCAGAEFQP